MSPTGWTTPGRCSRTAPQREQGRPGRRGAAPPRLQGAPLDPLDPLHARRRQGMDRMAPRHLRSCELPNERLDPAAVCLADVQDGQSLRWCPPTAARRVAGRGDAVIGEPIHDTPVLALRWSCIQVPPGRSHHRSDGDGFVDVLRSPLAQLELANAGDGIASSQAAGPISAGPRTTGSTCSSSAGGGTSTRSSPTVRTPTSGRPWAGRWPNCSTSLGSSAPSPATSSPSPAAAPRAADVDRGTGRSSTARRR
jgi:hypothetical protein